MINEGDNLWLYRPRMFNHYYGLTGFASNIHYKKSLLYMHSSFFSIMYEPRQYCCYAIKEW